MDWWWRQVVVVGGCRLVYQVCAHTSHRWHRGLNVQTVGQLHGSIGQMPVVERHHGARRDLLCVRQTIRVSWVNRERPRLGLPFRSRFGPKIDHHFCC